MVKPNKIAPVGGWVSTDADILPRSRSMPWQRLEETWDNIQVGRQGAYSIERLESFEYYCKTTSRTRVFLTCILTPLPAWACAVLLECLPLRLPSDGWSANWMFWFRLALMTFVLTFVATSELILFVPNLRITFFKRCVVSIGTSLAYVGTYQLATATGVVGFPVPFIWHFGGLLIGIYLPVMMLSVFGFAPFASCYLLFHSEYLALVEYVECIVPLVFAAYKLMLKNLPNVVYYPSGANNWGMTALTNILVFAALEVGSLFLLHYFLKRKFAYSPLYQLTFALETEIYLVQGSLFLEIVALLQYELEHFGK
ncbi:unnamed protein product [Phytophthora fragariaefolia]|uniref:Unnamed protein product n=1 Tax=Phytophthora fragariaefolia TaxID=1490495 RepID=A0A9W6U8Y4_9STRA|nr:unnamed protein product [Phytophthora fragariaefolia]